MPGVRKLLKWIFVLGPAVAAAMPAPRSAYPAGHALSGARASFASRQEPPPAAAPPAEAAAPPAAAPPAAAPPAAAPPAAKGGLTDVDILQFALTAEHLETEFYKQGFAKFPASEFKNLGLTDTQVTSLMAIGQSEATHVSTLISAVAASGAQPVEACQYNFNFSDAKTMVATARTLEAVGISAYLGAAPLINSSDVLSAAATIATVECRHQTFIRIASGADPTPAPFDTPLSPKAVFTLAAQFIQSCPQGSNLDIRAFPSINLQNPMSATAGQNLALADPAQPAGGKFCAFAASGGTQFSELSNGNCQVPQNLKGEVYMMISKSQSIGDAEVLAGPAVIQAS